VFFKKTLVAHFAITPSIDQSCCGPTANLQLSHSFILLYLS